MRSLLDAPLPAGPAQLAQDGRDDDGQAMAAGAYLARVLADGGSGRVRLMPAKFPAPGGQ